MAAANSNTNLVSAMMVAEIMCGVVATSPAITMEKKSYSPPYVYGSG